MDGHHQQRAARGGALLLGQQKQSPARRRVDDYSRPGGLAADAATNQVLCHALERQPGRGRRSHSSSQGLARDARNHHSFFGACVDAIKEGLGMDLLRGKSAQIDYTYQSFNSKRDEILYVGFDATDVSNPVPAKASRNVPTVWLAVDASIWSDWDGAGQARLEDHTPAGWSLNPSRRWGYMPQIWRYLDETLGDGPFEEQQRRLVESCGLDYLPRKKLRAEAIS
jgi:hypothetical protein